MKVFDVRIYRKDFPVSDVWRRRVEADSAEQAAKIAVAVDHGTGRINWTDEAGNRYSIMASNVGRVSVQEPTRNVSKPAYVMAMA